MYSLPKPLLSVFLTYAPHHLTGRLDLPTSVALSLCLKLDDKRILKRENCRYVLYNQKHPTDIY